MEVTVNMSAEEFQKFMDWKKERDYYEKELVKETDKREFMAKKTTWAIEKDPKRPGKVKIVDQEHGRSCWSWPMTTYHKKKTTCARC